MSPRTRRQRRARPAEKGTAIVAAVAAVIAYALNIDDREILLALPILVGAVPGAITWFVERRWESKH